MSAQRVIAIVNQGPDYVGQSDQSGGRVGHFWMTELARSVPNSSRMFLQNVNAEIAVVSMSSAWDAQVEFGINMPSPADYGWTDWISDVIRVERYTNEILQNCQINP